MISDVPLFFIVLLFNVENTSSRPREKSQFPFTDEARAALCPFVGTEGMQCFNGEPVQRTGKQSDTNILKLPRGVGISIDRSTGRLKAPVVQLTYSPETGRTWTDGFTGEMFHVFNEVIHSPATKVAAAYNASRIQIFRNASQLNATWQQTFVDGRIRGGSLAHPPDLYKFMTEFSRYDEAFVLSHSVTGLYTLAINSSMIPLNSFAHDALSKLTSAFDLDLYDDFVETWGTHIITKSAVGGMIEEQAKVNRCFHGDERSLVIRCLPLGERHSANPLCKYYSNQNKVIAKRRFGGNAQADTDHEWKQTLAFAPAILQILEMVPWYEFVMDESIKRNLRTIMRHRQMVAHSNLDQLIHWFDGRLVSCTRAIYNLSVDARWERNGFTIAGGNGGGGSSNQLRYPHGLIIDDDDDQTILILDFGNHRVIKWKRGATSGEVIAGGNGYGNRLDQLQHPTDSFIDKETNTLIIADWKNRRIVRWSRRRGTIQGEVIIDNVGCFGLAMDEQRHLFVSDIEKHEIRRYEIDRGDKTGILIAGGHGKGNGANQLNEPRYLFIDKSQSLYVLDFQNYRVMRWDNGSAEGVVVAGGQGAGNALTQLSLSGRIFVDASATVYIADSWNYRIIRWLPKAKQGTIVVGGNGQGVGANQFNVPVDFCFDKFGNLYVVDYYNHRVQQFNIIK